MWGYETSFSFSWNFFLLINSVMIFFKKKNWIDFLFCGYWFPSLYQFYMKHKKSKWGFMQKPAEVVSFYSFLCILKRELSMNQYSQYGEQAPQENHNCQGVVRSIIDPVSVDIVWLESYRARSWLCWSQWQLPYQLTYAKVIDGAMAVCLLCRGQWRAAVCGE